MKISKILVAMVLFVFMTVSSAQAAFWLQPTDLVLDKVQTSAGVIYVTVSWSAGSQVRFYAVVPGMDAGAQNQILAVLLTLKSLGDNFRLHINNASQVDGIEMLP